MEPVPAERETPADWGDGAVALGFRVKASSRESASQKASNVLEPDLRSHWSTGSNTKEWILLELQEPCLLSHVRIYNKSVLEWELTAGLRYKPDAFVKVRQRCEAPKRDMVYPGHHTPCRYVRISCLRGNPIAIFFIQLIGIPVPGLEPEFQPLVNYLLPQITSSKQLPSQNVHLQLLKDIASRLPPFLPQIETDLNSVVDNPESSVRFLALLAGPFYPIIYLVNERDPSKASITPADSDPLRTNVAATPTISSNFEAQPRRSRSPSSVQLPSYLLAFRSETSVLLLRKALKDKTLGIVCLRASKVLQKLLQPELDKSISNGGMLLNHNGDEISKSDSPSLLLSTYYSSLFEEEFCVSENQFDASLLSILDMAAVEEGILHVLYAAASQPLLCRKLVETTSDMWSVLPLVQALLPALRPPLSPGPIEQIDDSFNQWNHPTVQNALSQVVTMSVSSSVFPPLVRACAGYLSSYLSSHAKAACVLLDLCRGPFIAWIPVITAKIDFAVELVEDLLSIIQEAGRSLARSRAALKYFVLAISGQMDDMLAEYKEVMHKLLFILEMLDPFIDPSTSIMKNTIIFGGISAIYLEKQTSACDVALNIIRTAVKRADVLPSLELEWRRGAVAPSVILSILDPHMPLPPDIDLCKSTMNEIDHVSLAVLDYSAPQPSNPENIDGHDTSETVRPESFEQCNSFFAPEELKQSELTRLTLNGNGHDGTTQTSLNQETPESRLSDEKLSSNLFQLDNITAADYFDAQADYQQLMNHQDCELRAQEFQHLALNLCMQQEPTLEGHNAGIDALLLAAESYVNPFFLLDFQLNSERLKKIERIHSELMQGNASFEPKDLHLKDLDLVSIYNLENKRDKSVFDLLLQAARFDCEYHKKRHEGEPYPDTSEDDKQSVQISAEALQFVDALTLVRKNQAMLWHFIMKQFRRKEHSHSEILLQSLLFLLHSATDLFCPPEDIIDIILKSAENLNEQLSCLYSCINAGNKKLDRVKLHGLKRRWTLLQKLVLASSGSDNSRELVSIKRDGFRFRSLVPPSAWIHKIPDFSRFSSPLPRFLGWMAVSRYAREYLNERLFLASDFSQLTSLLSIYMDELSLVDRVAMQKAGPVKHELSDCSKHLLLTKKETAQSVQPNMTKQFKILLPELHFFFPSMCKLFNAFGESILEAVGIQLKCLPNSAIQDVLCWFSEMCLWPYLELIKEHLLSANRVSYLRGNVAANAKAVVLYLLESIVVEHVEAIIPEMPRIVHILVSLCRASYTDVGFLNSVLCLVKPLISYYLKNRADVEKVLDHATECSDFELLCFEEFFEVIQCVKLSKGTAGDKIQVPLLIFILGSMFPDFSFERRIAMLQSVSGWADYLSSDPPSLLCSYLQSFQTLLDGCETVLVQNIEFLGIRILSATSNSVESSNPLVVDSIMQLYKKAQDRKEDIPYEKFTEHCENGESYKILHSLHPNSIKEFCGILEKFISHLTPSIEDSWKWHHQLASRLSLSIAKCLLFAKLLNSVLQEDLMSSSNEHDVAMKISCELAHKHWESALDGLVEIILVNQETQCWQVASAMLDYIIKIPNIFTWGKVLNSICSAVKHFCSQAPRISWRLQTEKWLPLLVCGGLEDLKNREIYLIDLFFMMLSHSEPEQRSVALQQLGRIINSTSHAEADSKSPMYDQNVIRSDSAVASLLATNTWDRVVALALHDSSMLLRNHAMALLSEYVPFVDVKHLRSFLGSSNHILNSVGQISGVVEEGYMTRMSLLLLSRACLYSSPEDIALIPECVWRKLESMQASTGSFSYMEKDLCRALCQLRSESDAKTGVKEVLSGCTRKPISSDFKSIRESILQVLSSLSSVDAYFEFFSARSDQEYQELEEAEIELELIEKEKADHDVAGHPHDTVVADMLPYRKDDQRLQEIQENIRSLERSRLKEEITTRRQKKLLIRHAREKYLEETRSKEMELMQELDRERALEMEREIERQRQLDIERAKSRELKFNLDMEKEKQTQKELQRELEQVELGRSSRREYSANPNSRSRERYRERDGGRSQQEGSLRSSSRGHEGGGGSGQAVAPAGGSSSTVMLAGSITFSGGNLPTILQPRERAADEDSAWGEGSRDSGDTSSIGDPEFDGMRQHGPRGSGSKSSSSRQLIERRDRDGAASTARREGKWERKQHS